MAKTLPPAAPVVPPAKIDILGGILSYLIPGLGQMSQGRVSKGLLFFVCLHGLFFYGMYLGRWQNVYLPARTELALEGQFKRVRAAVADRIQIVGQGFIGLSAWPAFYQFYHATDNGPERLDGFQKEPDITRLNEIQREFSREWDLGLVYTVIAGVLNLLVIYDAVAGPAFRELPASQLLPAPTPSSGNTTGPTPLPRGEIHAPPGRLHSASSESPTLPTPPDAPQNPGASS